MIKTRIKISDKGRVSFNLSDLFPQGKWRNLFYDNYSKWRNFSGSLKCVPSRNYALGFDILYCERSAELALEIYRLENGIDLKKQMREVGATLWLKRDSSICISRYFKSIPLLYKHSRDWIEAKIIGNHIIVKLDGTNTSEAPLSEFKKIQLKRMRNQDCEILFKPSGVIAVPRSFANKRTDFGFDPDTQTVTLTLNENGVRAIRKDGTFNIATLLRPFGVKPPRTNKYLPFTAEGNTLTFRLEDDDPTAHTKAVISLKEALGIIE